MSLVLTPWENVVSTLVNVFRPVALAAHSVPMKRASRVYRTREILTDARTKLERPYMKNMLAQLNDNRRPGNEILGETTYISRLVATHTTDLAPCNLIVVVRSRAIKASEHATS